jgi:hypothetical protein
MGIALTRVLEKLNIFQILNVVVAEVRERLAVSKQRSHRFAWTG